MAVYHERLKVTDAIKETAEIGGGFVVNGFLGREIENRVVTTPVDATSTTSQKILAAAANNAPKLALYYLFKKVNLDGAAASSIGSVGYDALIRLTNQGVNPANVKITLQGKDYRILNQLQQENTYLKNQLSQTSQQALPWWGNPQEAEFQRRYGAMPFSNQPTPVLDRQRKYGAMPNFDRPQNWQQPRYGSLPFEQSEEKQGRQVRYGFAGKLDSRNIGTLFSML